MAISVVSFSFSRATQPEAWGPILLGAGFLYRILSSTGLVSKLTDFLSSLSFIIVQSPTQSLEWHVWSSSSGNNCHAVHRSLSSGASVYRILSCPILSANPAYAISSHNCHRNVSLPPSLEWHVWPGRRSTYNKSIRNVAANVLDFGIVVNEFELLSRYYYHFWTNTLVKGMNQLCVK